MNDCIFSYCRFHILLCAINSIFCFITAKKSYNADEIDSKIQNQTKDNEKNKPYKDKADTTLLRILVNFFLILKK